MRNTNAHASQQSRPAEGKDGKRSKPRPSRRVLPITRTDTDAQKPAAPAAS